MEAEKTHGTRKDQRHKRRNHDCQRAQAQDLRWDESVMMGRKCECDLPGLTYGVETGAERNLAVDDTSVGRGWDKVGGEYGYRDFFSGLSEKIWLGGVDDIQRAYCGMSENVSGKFERKGARWLKVGIWEVQIISHFSQ